MAGFSPIALTIADILDANARYLSNKTAVQCDNFQLTWSEFGRRISRVGNALLDSGLKKGDRVVVLMNNSADMAEAMMGIIRGGLVAVPLNISITDAAVAAMIQNSGARAVIASGEHVKRIESIRAQLGDDTASRLICAETIADGWISYDELKENGSPDAPRVDISPQDECNIIYSSGTTGLPKGIVHDHRCRVAWASDMAVALRYHSGARTLLTLGLFSNITWVCMLATFFAGGTIIISRHFDPAESFSTIERQRVTHTGMVPLQYQKLFESKERQRFRLETLEASMCCGSALPLWLKKGLAKEWPGSFIELYGLTEGLVTILSPEDLLSKPESVGLPCPGQRLGILSNNNELLGPGESGEIVGTCRFIMSGYHENLAANKEATWIHPSGERWLRTGDVGRLDEDGFLYLVDRKKDMIVSGGQNVYPADIESTMFEHPDISDVAVIGLNSAKWGETPVAVVVTRNDIAVGEIVDWTNDRVGKQQRIAAAILIDELPRNPNGKVLKRVLRDQYAHLTFHG
ncbi:MAG: class I adenylate-forming enzyme family protein [Gammaproteobacteria bacterium]